MIAVASSSRDAVQSNPELTRFAVDNHGAIATPTTLITAEVSVDTAKQLILGLGGQGPAETTDACASLRLAVGECLDEQRRSPVAAQRW